MKPLKVIITVLLLNLLLIACEQKPIKRDGKAIYNQSCISCHERGHGGAPKRGDMQAWQQRLMKSEAELLKNLKEGYKSMPPKGACFDCSDQELQKVLDYILQSSGQN